MKAAAIAFVGGMMIMGVANAQGVDTGTAAGNTKEFYSCGVPPCVGGVPPAAPGGEGGSGPGALRTAPVDSPVGTGAGSGGPGGTKGSGGSGN